MKKTEIKLIRWKRNLLDMEMFKDFLNGYELKGWKIIEYSQNKSCNGAIALLSEKL